MSLDVYLSTDISTFPIAADLLEENGFPDAASHLRSVESKDLYSANITHNLGKMADACGIYQALWRPEEINVRYARDLIPLLTEGLEKLESDPKHYETFNAENGWGLYEHFVPFVRHYLGACINHPDAAVSVSR